jgi:molybdopterin-containing oxidoreductase family membrane subunit
MEHFIAWYSADPYEYAQFFLTRMHGPMRWVYRVMVFCNCVVPQIFWSKRWRTSIPAMWVASIFINVGMWCERYNIVVTSLHRDFLPSKWENYLPTWVDLSLFAGTIGLFSTLFLLFLKFVPAVALTEVKELRHELQHDPTAEPAGETH